MPAPAQMFADGLVEETRGLLRQYGESPRAFDALGYRQARAVLRDELTELEAIAATRQAHRNYAKRQLTWFRREPDVHWLARIRRRPRHRRACRRASSRQCLSSTATTAHAISAEHEPPPLRSILAARPPPAHPRSSSSSTATTPSPETRASTSPASATSSPPPSTPSTPSSSLPSRVLPLSWTLAAIVRLTHLPLAWTLLAASPLSIVSTSRASASSRSASSRRSPPAGLRRPARRRHLRPPRRRNRPRPVMDPYLTARSFSTPLGAVCRRRLSRPRLAAHRSAARPHHAAPSAHGRVCHRVRRSAGAVRLRTHPPGHRLLRRGFRRLPEPPSPSPTASPPQPRIAGRLPAAALVPLPRPLALVRNSRPRSSPGAVHPRRAPIPAYFRHPPALCARVPAHRDHRHLIAACFIPPAGPFLLVPLQILRSFHLIYAVGVVLCGGVLAAV